MHVRLAILIATFLIGPFVWAHGDHHHPDTGEPSATPSADQAKIQQIRQAYESRVKPIFEKSCFDCHTTQTKFPRYASWPIAKQIIDYDLTRARHHLDMTDGFPFKSHASLDEDLDAIKDAVNEGDMPPWRYWIFHSGTKLTADEKKAITGWAEDGMKILGAKGD